MLNLFLAILINNFVESRKNYTENGKKDLIAFSLESSIHQFKFYLQKVKEKTKQILKVNDTDLKKSPSLLLHEELLQEVELPPGSEDYHKNFDYRLFPVTIDLDSNFYHKLQKSSAILLKKGTRVINLIGRSLFIFSNSNRFRLFLFKWMTHHRLKKAFMYTAVISAIFPIFNDPLSNPKGGANLAFEVLRHLFGWIFIIHISLNIICFGLLFNGKDSYLRHGMHLLEFILCIFFLVSYSSAKGLGAVSVFRLVYLIEIVDSFFKSSHAKVVLKSLLRSLPSIFGLIFIELLFFYALGVLNVSFFKGTFFACDVDNVPGRYY
jgi:hypothetical protein